MATSTVSRRIGSGDHVCWVFDDDKDAGDAIAGYVAGGLAHHDKIVCLAHTRAPDELINDLAGAGVAVEAALSTGQMLVGTARDAYLSAGGVSLTETSRHLQAQIEIAQGEGWRGLRAVGDMAWAASGHPAARLLLPHEAAVNTVIARGYASALCLYDRRLFPTSTLDEVAGAHAGTVWEKATEQWSPMLRMRRTDDPPVLTLSGAADCSNRQALAVMIRDVLHTLDGGTQVVIDITRLEFIDAAAGHLLAHAAHTGAIMRGGSPTVNRVIGILGGLPPPAAGEVEVP